MADALFLFILFYSFIMGARRGFYKEVIGALALLISILIAWHYEALVGSSLAARTGMPVLLARFLGAAGLWGGSFFVVALVGRLILKKLRGQGVDDALERSAEGVADALAGDTTPGVVTLLTNPIASKRGFVYWSDKLLGALLGLIKGVISTTFLFAILLTFDRLSGWDTALARSIQESHAQSLYHEHLQPTLESIPELRLLPKLITLTRIADEVQKDPGRQKTLREHSQLRGLKDLLQELGQDAELVQAWSARDFGALLTHPRIKKLLSQREVRRRLAEVDWEQLLSDLRAKKPQPAPTPEAPPSAPLPPETKRP